MTEREQLEKAMAAQEAQRSVLGDEAVDAALAALRRRQTELDRAQEDRERRPAAPLPSTGERKLVAVTDRTGDVMLRTRCLTYLTVGSRKREQVDDVRQYGSQALAAATTARMPEYVGAAKANLAWLAWHDGDVAEMQANAQAALESWRGYKTVYPFQWLVLMPLIDLALSQERVSEAIDHMRALFDPEQQRLPDSLTQAMEGAIAAWEQNEPETARDLATQVVELAAGARYLQADIPGTAQPLPTRSEAEGGR